MRGWITPTLTALMALGAAGLSRADDAIEPTTRPIGDEIRLGYQAYKVRVMSADWQMTETEEGNRAFWKDGRVVVFDLGRAAEEKEIACPWRLEELSRARRFAIVHLPAKPGQARLAVADLTAGRIVAEVPENVCARRWAFTEHYAIPVAGSGQYAAVKLQGGEVITVALPGADATATDWLWSGWAEDDGKAHLLLWEEKTWQTYQGTIDLDQPTRGEFKPDKISSFLRPIGADAFLGAVVHQLDMPAEVAVVSKATGEIREKMNDDSERAHALMGRTSLDGKESWYVDSMKGTTIYDLKTGKAAAQAPGKSWNAQNLGVTFGAHGTLAVIAEPYEGTLWILRTADHAVIAKYKTASPAGGILIEPKKKGDAGELVIFQTNLPYE